MHNADPDNPSKGDLRKLGDKEVKELAKQLGYDKDVHRLKEDYLGKGASISKFDIVVDKSTGSYYIIEKKTGKVVTAIGRC